MAGTGRLGEQLARPRGLGGLLAGELLAWTNRGVNRWTLALLALDAEARVLEIGFGPGVGVRLAAAVARRGLVAGVDPSAVMVRRARWRNRRALRQRRVDLRRAAVEALPWPAHTFTHAFSVNAFQEWPDLERGLAEVARVLRPGGRLALTTQERQAVSAADAAAGDEHTLAQMERAGFRELRREWKPMRPRAAVCLLGRLGGGVAPKEGRV
ncbi:MAG TPA: class I SAM-dependent methyltransferase [Thermoanaerobaculia bacterium]|nr:class I SAM-dependent methyltransferase [Thermoanaerobaculia bacterium]